MDQLVALGSKEYAGLETFTCIPAPFEVTLESDEVTALCPVTGQPDWYRVTIRYRPLIHALESKSVKLYLHSFRDRGIFCEALANEILEAVLNAAEPEWCSVKVEQKPRGGVKLVAESIYRLPDDDEKEATAAFMEGVPHEQYTEGG